MAQVEALIGIYGLAVRVQGPGSGSVQAMRSEILSDIEKPQPELLFVQPNQPFLASSEERLVFDAAFGAAAGHKWGVAAKAFRLLAEKGNAVAQCAMGYVCQYDLLIGSLPKELKEPFNFPSYLLDFPDNEVGCGLSAAKWFRLAAEQGSNIGRRELGVMYIRRAYLFGIKWLRLSGHSGDVEAQFVLGQVLARHVSMGSTAQKQGYKENYEEAAWWYWKAAVGGHPLGWKMHISLIDKLYD